MDRLSQRILAGNRLADNNAWASGLNNNDLIIGPPGAGKTRGYVIPNILQCNESMIISDAKGDLCPRLGHILSANGYTVLELDLADCEKSPYGYNPLDYIRTWDGAAPSSPAEILPGRPKRTTGSRTS